MVRDSIKLIVAAVILLIAGGLIAAFATGYISAFKPGGTKDAAQSASYSGGGAVGGVTAAVTSPSPEPSTMPYPEMKAPEAVAQPEMPEQAPAGPASLPGMPYAPSGQLPVPLAGSPPGPGLDEGAIVNAPGPIPAPSSSPQAPITDREGPWPGGRIATDRPLPSLQPAMPVIPQFGQPATSNGPYMPLSPYEAGWMQIIQRLINLLPLLFPDSGFVHSWWPQTS